ncbi:DUF1542 domain-containing protein [Streptococcus suis]|uniref:DUF1542 domain-containing protein n=3 Tax=Streptococcus suis TaxID=1307 RepID=UPI0021189AD9|nr:DUF1542 domain-containing protein [Streptococcus suis]MCQ8271705.1 DUF1542 domain-containing protein [Streptococcus suis]UUM49590.1 DUF1542 domain-containing protein [Streptococcus suis]HEL1770219.1 DUF1542 domain-containing protein [Streptococcus suis]HEL1783325.1 DUF1542 domain-containing protein [Streptococcus suis]HEL2597025.1 DUF1542 domain-containing protein [Streptococcus suis]
MSSKDIFRKEQRFSFRKFSFGLASAVIANVIFGGAIASSPVVHANTATETAAVATSERIASIPYTVNIVDQAGKVVDTQAKNVSVQTTEATAVATANLTTDLVPEGYALVSGLGQVTVTENAENVFTVVVEKVVSEVASTETSTSATAVASETSTVATPEPASLAATQSTPVTSEVAEAEVAPTTPEESAKPTERTAYLSYITHYVNEANETVDRTGHLVAVKTTDETAKTQVTVSASENMPSGYELVQDKAKVVVQLVENQTNILVFAVTKKSEEEEIAESQLSNRDVLTQVTSEADLLADEALRQVAGEQAGNTALETAANDTKAAATAANQVLANATATEAELGAQIDTVRTSTQNLATEMLKVDKDGILTAMLDTTQVSRPANYQEIGTEAGAFHPDKTTLTRYLFVFGTAEGTTESDANGTLNAAPVVNKAAATRALVPAGTITNIVYNDGKTNTGTLGSNLTMDTNGFLEGTFNHTAGGPYTRKLIVTTDTGRQTSNEFTVYAYTDKASSDPVEKSEDQTLTQNEVFAKMAIATTSTAYPNNGKNIPTVPATEYTRTILGYRTVTVEEDGSKVKGELVKQEDLAQFPTDKDLEVKVQTTNIYGQTIYNWVKVDYNLKPKVEIVDAVGSERKTVYVFSKNSGTTEDSAGATGTNVAFNRDNATKAVVNITDDGKVTRIGYNDAKNDTTDMFKEHGAGEATVKVGTDGYFIGAVDVPAGSNTTRLLKVTDDKGLVGQSPVFRVYAFSDTVPADVTPVRLAKGTRPDLEEITAKMVIDSNSGYPNNAKVAIPEDAYTRTVVGYRLDGSLDTVAVDSVEELPTEGSYKVRVKTSNAYGQEIYNWVPVSHYKLEEVSRDTVTKYTDFDSPIHAIVELGSSGTVGTVKLEGDLPADFNIANFNLKEGEAAKLAERNLEFVKADAIGQDGTVGTIRPKDGGKVEYTGSGNIEYVFEYNYQVNNENKTSNLTYTILYTDTKAPVMTPKSEYIRFVDEEYKISVPGTDNAFLSTEKINGTLSVLKDGESGRLVSSDLGTNTAITSELDPKGVDVSGGVDNQGGNSTMFNVNITGTAPSAEGTGTYKLRVGENNYPAGPNVERVDGKVPENVGLTPVTVTFVKRAAMTTPVAVVDPANLTADEKAAVIAQLKKDNADNEKLNALPDTAFTVNADGTVSVDYSAGNTGVDAVTDKVANATVKLADEQKKAKDAIDTKLAEEKAAIEAKRDEAIAEINNTPGLTDDQKKAATDAVTNTANDALTALDTAADDAKKAIDTETTVAGINDAKTAGEKALDDATAKGEAAIELTKEKELAKADVDNQAKDAIEAIKNNPNLDATEQAPYIEAIEKAVEEQKAAIDAAKDTAGITDAVDAAEKVNEEQKLAAAKEDAKDKIAEEAAAAAAAKEAIDNNPNLSDAEKQAAKDAVDAEVAKANDAIDQAKTPAEAQTAEDNGVKAIDAEELAAAKQDAKNKIAKDVEAAKDAIDKNPNLSEDEKKGFKDAVDTEAAKAVTDIEKATTPAEAQTAEEAGTAAIAADVLDAAKQDAKNKIDEDVKAAKEAIDNNPNLSEDEKQTFKDAVDEAAQTAKGEIDKATTPAVAQTAEEAGTAAIAADVLDAAKQDAKNKIDEDVKAAKEAIDNNPNLSEDEKQTFKDAVDEATQTAKGEIDKATTPAVAQTAEEAGTVAIAEDVLDAAKQDAKNKIAKDLATVEAAIDANSNLSQDEKDAAKLAAQAKEAEAVANIEKATTPEAAQTLEDAAVKDLANIEIKAAYDDAVKAIEAADNLSTAAKTQALEDLKKARQAAEDAIKTATTADEVAKGALDGLKSLAKVEAKAAADDAKAAADDAKAAIAQNSNLTDAEKKVYTDAIDEALKDTETKIDAATDADTVDAETVLAQKDIAKQEVAAATADAVKGIEANTNLTDAEKDEYKATVTKVAETAEKAIADATTAADIQSKTFDATQDVAKEEVKADAADAIAGIKANDNLSDTAKEEAIAAIEEARDTTLENIENAKTAADVDAATLDAEKANAKAEIKAAAEDAKKAIDENANLPESEKTALKLAIDAEVAATNLEIDNAKTAEEIDAATLATEKSIAKAEVKAAAEDALQAIDENANLTDDEKAAAKADVYVELSKAEKAINKATTADAIDNATLVGEKAFATAELEAAADDAKKAIDANTHLTDDQKQAAKDAVDADGKS